LDLTDCEVTTLRRYRDVYIIIIRWISTTEWPPGTCKGHKYHISAKYDNPWLNYFWSKFMSISLARGEKMKHFRRGADFKGAVR